MSTAQDRPGSLVVRGAPVPLPVEVRDARLALVAVGSVEEAVALSPGTYAVSVPIPGQKDFHRAVRIAPGGESVLHLPPAQDHDGAAPSLGAIVDAAAQLVEQGHLSAAVHVLSQNLDALPPAGLALLGFTALQVNQAGRAREAAARPTAPDPDVLALRTALLREQVDDVQSVRDELAGLVTQALGLGPPRLTVSAFALVAALRDADSPATPSSRSLLRLVRRSDSSRALLVVPPTDTPAPSGAGVRAAMPTTRQPLQIRGGVMLELDLAELVPGPRADLVVSVSAVGPSWAMAAGRTAWAMAGRLARLVSRPWSGLGDPRSRARHRRVLAAVDPVLTGAAVFGICSLAGASVAVKLNLSLAASLVALVATMVVFKVQNRRALRAERAAEAMRRLAAAKEQTARMRRRRRQLQPRRRGVRRG